MIKLITAKAFSSAIEIDEQGKIIYASKGFSKFINTNITVLEDVLRRNKFQALSIEDIQEAE